jgi:hypothetical protein
LSPLKYYHSANPGILVWYMARIHLIICGLEVLSQGVICIAVFWKNERRPVSSPCYLTVNRLPNFCYDAYEIMLQSMYLYVSTFLFFFFFFIFYAVIILS